MSKRQQNFFKTILNWFSLITVFKVIYMSTTYAIVDVLTISYDHINDNNFTCTVPLNFQKAFDTVCHTLILS